MKTRNRDLARKAATARAPASRRTLAVKNSEDNGNVETEVKGKGKGREEGGSKARPQDGLDAREEGATSSAGYPRGRRGHQRTSQSAASMMETKIEAMDVSAESPSLDLSRCNYNQQPILKMRVADLRDALRALGCDQDGKRPELLDRLANRLMKDSTGGNSGPAPADETSERIARYQKRRTLKAFTPLREGRDTRESPITISSDDEVDADEGSPIGPKKTAGDEEPGAEASNTLGPLAAGSTKASARTDASARTSGRVVRGAKTIAAGGKGVDGRSEAEVSLAAGPKPGMTRAELLEAVKGLGLKPRGARKVDLEACWHEAVKSRTNEKSSKGDKESHPSVAGVPVMTMTVAVLRKHVRGMGLKPSGQLKADLQRCLCEHLLEAQRATPTVAPTEECSGLSPNCVSFRGIPVAHMEPDTMCNIMNDLDVPTSRKSTKEVTHDLVEALVLRRAEALESRATKQRWRGRPVYKMKKMEVTNALHHFGADESGNVDDMRSRFRQLLRDWATKNIVIMESDGGTGGETIAVDEEKDSANPDSPASNRRKTNMIASTRNESRNDFEEDKTEADADVSDATTVTDDGNDRGLLPLRVGGADAAVTRAARSNLSTRGESSRGEERQDVEMKGEVEDKEDAGDGGDGGGDVTSGGDNRRPRFQRDGGEGGGGGGDGDGDENRDAGAVGSGSEVDIEEEKANSALGVEDQVEDEGDVEEGEEEKGKDGEGEGKEKQDEEMNDVEGEVEGKFDLDQATDGKPSHVQSSEAIAVSDGSPEVVGSARCPELRNSDKGEATDERIESDRAAMDADDTDGVNVDARSVSQGDRAPVEVATQSVDGPQWPDCPASEEELEGDTVEEVDTEEEACEGGTENFDDESEHLDDGDIEQAPAHEDKDMDNVNVEFEAGEEAGPTQTPQGLGMVRADGEKEYSDVYLTGAPGSACTESKTDDPLTTADCSEGLRAEREAESVMAEDSALCSESGSSGEGAAVGGVIESDGVTMEVGNANETDHVSQTAKPENPTPESTAQPQDGFQLTDCLEGGEEAGDTDTVEEVDFEGMEGKEGTGTIEVHGVNEEEVEAEGTEDASAVALVSQTVQLEDRPPELVAQPQHDSQGMDCSAEGDEAEGDTDTVEEMDADEEAREIIESNGVDDEEVKVESTKDPSGAECVSQTVNPEDRSPEPAAQPQDGSQLTDCLAEEAECDTDTVVEMGADGEAREEDVEIVESHVVNGEEVEAEGMEDTCGAECVSQTLNQEDWAPEPAAQPQEDSQWMDYSNEGGEFEDKIVGGADTDGNVREIDEGSNESNRVDEEEVETEDMKDYAEDDDDAGEQAGPKVTSEVNMGMEGESERETAGRDNACAEAEEDEDPNDDTGGMDDGEDLGDYFEEEGYVEQNDIWAGEKGREAQDEEGEDKEQDIDGDEDEDEDDSEMALEEHVDEEEAESWEDGNGVNDERALDYDDEDNNEEGLDNDDGGDYGVASDYGDEGVDKGASEDEDDEGEGEGEREGIAMGMALAMTGDTEEAAIDLAESDEEADNCAPINDEYDDREGSSSDDREAGSIEDGEASVPSDVDSPVTIAAVDNSASASAEPVQRVETCVENVEGAVKDDAYADDMDEEDSDEFFDAREALEDPQDRTEASFSGTVDDTPAVEATVDDVTDDREVGSGAAAGDPREAASSSNGDPAIDARNMNAHNVSPCTRTWFEARDRHPQTVTQPPHSLAPGNGHDHHCTKSDVKTEPRDSKAEFRALFGELGVDGKTAALDFLANPTVRPVNPSLPMLTAEEERSLASATCSASEWDDKVVLALNPFSEQSRQLLGRRYVSNCYAGRASDPRWPSGHATVPAMKSRDLSPIQPTVASRPTRPDASGEGMAYVEYSAFSTPTRHQAETHQASDEPTSGKDKEPMVSEQYQRSLLGEQFGRARLMRPSLPGFASNASPFSSASLVPSYSMGPKGSIAPSQAVTPGIDRKPAFSPRRSVGSGIGGRPARTLQANSPSVLRYRLRDLSSRRRSRSSLCPSLGPAHEGLGSKPGAGDSGRVAKDDLVQNEMRQGGQQPSTNNSTVHFHGTAARENSRTRYQAFMSESEGAGTMKSRRMTMDGAEERALRVAAASKATTEVENILLSVVSGRKGGGDAIDVRRQAREEAQVVDIARDAFTGAENDGESTAEFSFSTSTKYRRKLTDTPARRRPPMFSFANVVPAKRSRPARDRKLDGSDPQSLASADGVGAVDDESSGVFEFSRQHAPGRRVRQRVRVDTSATSSIVAPSMTPLEAEGSRTSHSSHTAPSPAPTVDGFDMSLFRKPGEWKCEACLVKNPPGGDKCLSCETPKSGAGGGGGGVSVAEGPGEKGVTASTVGGALFSGGALSTTTTTMFSFGAQPARDTEPGDSASSAALGHSLSLSSSAAPTFAFGSQQYSASDGSSAASAALRLNNAAPLKFGVQDDGIATGGITSKAGAFTSPAAPGNGFDMSKFVKPGEWKCEACCVRNPPSVAKCLSCETPKSGGASAWSTGKSAIGGRAGNPSASAPGAFLFSAPSASGLNQEPGGPLFQSPGPATGALGGFIFGTGGGSVGNSTGYGGPLAQNNFGRPPVLAPGTSRNPSGLFGTAENSTQSGSGTAFWSASAPQPQGFMFGSDPSSAGANSPPPSTKKNSPRSSAF